MEHIVYVVDDDDTVRQSVVRLLESADMHALGFSSAEAFLSHPFEDLPSCVILDMQMPTITGFNVADALKASGGNDSNLLIVFYVQIMPDDLVMQLHRF